MIKLFINFQTFEQSESANFLLKYLSREVETAAVKSKGYLVRLSNAVNPVMCHL